jgi:hypothetical protein
MGSSFEISGSARTRARGVDVMALILDPSTWPRWQAEILSADGPSPLRPGDVAAGRAEMLGFDVDGQSITTEVSDEGYAQSVVVGVGMTITYRLRALPDGTEITHTLTSQLPQGTMGRVLSFFLARRLRKMQRELLSELARQAEGSAS